jgi:predicted DCC family thiol-disulfide oxidoreductase YuxK
MGWIFFFDGDCAFCSAGVRRVMRLDRNKRIRFAPLQGKLSREKGFEVHADPAGGTMVLMRESDGAVFLRSDAVVELTRALGGWWRAFLPARLVPRHRYWLSKKGDFCVLPDPEMESRILE